MLQHPQMDDWFTLCRLPFTPLHHLWFSFNSCSTFIGQVSLPCIRQLLTQVAYTLPFSLTRILFKLEWVGIHKTFFQADVTLAVTAESHPPSASRSSHLHTVIPEAKLHVALWKSFPSLSLTVGDFKTDPWCNPTYTLNASPSPSVALTTVCAPSYITMCCNKLRLWVLK